MRVMVKLDERKKGETAQGFPIVVRVYTTKAKIFRTGHFSKVKNWNAQLAQPKNSHPDYTVLLDYINRLKANIQKLLIASHTKSIGVAEVPIYLFKQRPNLFFEAAMEELGVDSKTSAASAVRAFSAKYPSVAMDEISRDMVEKFIAALLKKGNKPGGVDSYIRSLRAIWNKISDLPNPFTGHRLRFQKKPRIVASDEDIRVLQNADLRYHGIYGSEGRYRDYWLLCFYLGGIDPEVLVRMRYDENVINNRLQFNRQKGNSSMACNVLIAPQAWQILERFDCKPYLVPLYKAKNTKWAVDNYRARFKKVCEKLGLSVQLRPKSARYTFINMGKELFIDQRLVGQIVGHQFSNTTSLYENDYALSVQDKAHLQIIDF